MTTLRLTRRDLMAGLMSAPLLAPVVGCSRQEDSIRLCHLTDLHIQPELKAHHGCQVAFEQAMLQKPDLIITGGDLIMDGLAAKEARVKRQWELWSDVVRTATCPIYHTIGNHDVWGWNQKSSDTTGTEAKWGKAWFQEVTKTPATRQSFQHGPWQFLILDTVQPGPGGYVADIDPEQLEWLDGELKKHKERPTVIVSHMPILSVTPILLNWKEDVGAYNVRGTQLVRDNGRLIKLFESHKQVKLCLSGHIHMVDRVDYKGVAYICGGAVSGAWWLGPMHGFSPGFMKVDLHANGTFDADYVAWGWRIF